MIYDVGVDVVEIHRLAEALERRPRLLERLFAPSEVAYAEGPHCLGRLAARFAAKEAIVKACHGFRGSRWNQLVVDGTLNRPPTVRVEGPLGDWIRERGGQLRVSLSHEKSVVVAVAILEMDDAGNLDGA
jgi:holo-[acyl-carrier protein] synthase